MPLPLLREELALLPGPVLADGQPSWTLHDPVRNLFFQVDWPTFEVLQRWWMQEPALIAADIDERTTLRLEAADVRAVAQFLINQQLVRTAGVASARQLAERVAKMRSSPWQWLLHRYLFFRIPLWRPDAWLTRWLPLAELACSRAFLRLTLLALLAGLALVARQWDVFTGTLEDTFDGAGLLAYSAAIMAVKLLHELGHAFAARRHGCRVPAMGVAFLVMWPVAYTDTNEAWRLTDRMQRLKIACAGIATELAVAAWATLAWALLPEGALRDAAFVLATTSWVATLAVNASPFMRFDGYFILSDWLDFPNLHERSFALARWRLRELLFGLGEEPPESFGAARARMLVLFAWCVWIYRLVLFVGIALLVYHFFFKLLGMVLFMVEIAWFVWNPIRKELAEWRRRWASIRRNRRAAVTGLAALGCAGLLALPWPTGTSAMAMVRPVDVWPVHVPAGARIEALMLREGGRVAAGAELARLQAPDLQARHRALSAKVEQLRWQAAASGLDDDTRARIQVNEQALVTAQAELGSIEAELRGFSPRAPFAGIVREVDPELHAGQWLSRKERMAVVVKEGTAWSVETWLDEESVRRIRVGDAARFVSEGPRAQVLALQVASIERDAARELARRELALPAGGHLAVREKQGRMVPEQAVYRVTLSPREAWTGLTERGRLDIRGDWESPAARYARHALALAVRELGF